MIVSQTQGSQVYTDSGVLHTPHHGTHATLICLLYLVLAVAFAAAEWLPSGSGVFLTSVTGALLCGLLISYSRANVQTMFGFGLVVSLSWTLFQVSSQIPELDARVLTLQGHSLLQARAYLFLNQWWEWGATVLNRKASSDNLVFLFNMSFLLWWIAYFGTWTLLRYGQTWRSILTAGIVTAVNTYYAPTAITLLFVVFILVALLLLASSHLASLQSRWQREGIRYTSDIVFDFMRNALIFSLIAVVIAWGIPRLGLFQALNRILQPVNIVWERTTDQIAEWNQGLNQQARESAGSFQDTLTLGGSRQAADDPVLVVQTQSGHDQSRYWRANAYDHFNGSQWRNTLTDRRTFAANQTIPAPQWSHREFLRQTFLPQQDLGFVVLAVPNITRTSLSTVALYETVFPAASQDLSSIPADSDPPATDETQELIYVKSKERITPDFPYEVTSALTAVTIWDLERASDHVPDSVKDKYLQLPDQVDPNVVEQALAWTAGVTNRYGQAKALESALRRIPYDDHIEAPPPGTDPVAYFLFDVQRGYCDYYATAMVVMLRTLGVPARLAAGYAEGAYDREADRFLITEADAHSWVEVYFGELGWIEFEPTAGESVLLRDPGGPPVESPSDPSGPTSQLPDNPQDSLLSEDIPEDFLQDSANPDATTGDRTARPVPPWIWFGLTGVFLLVCAGLVATGVAEKVWYRILARNSVSGSPSPRLSSIAFRYLQLMRWAKRLYIPLSSNMTPWERYDWLSKAFPDLAPSLETIVGTYVRHFYGTTETDLRQSTDQIEVERQWQLLQLPLWRTWLTLRLGNFWRKFLP